MMPYTYKAYRETRSCPVWVYLVKGIYRDRKIQIMDGGVGGKRASSCYHAGAAK